MKTIEAIIEKASDGTYSVFCKNEIFTGMGDTAELAKQNMLEQMSFYKETCKKDGHTYPSFLDNKYDISLDQRDA